MPAPSRAPAEVLEDLTQAGQGHSVRNSRGNKCRDMKVRLIALHYDLALLAETMNVPDEEKSSRRRRGDSKRRLGLRVSEMLR